MRVPAFMLVMLCAAAGLGGCVPDVVSLEAVPTPKFSRDLAQCNAAATDAALLGQRGQALHEGQGLPVPAPVLRRPARADHPNLLAHRDMGNSGLVEHDRLPPHNPAAGRSPPPRPGHAGRSRQSPAPWRSPRRAAMSRAPMPARRSAARTATRPILAAPSCPSRRSVPMTRSSRMATRWVAPGSNSSSSSSRGTPCSSTNTSKRSSQCAPHEIGAELGLDDPFARHLVFVGHESRNRKRKS